jgi:hypothetical protein
MQANDSPLVAQAVSPANRIFSQLLREGLPKGNKPDGQADGVHP